MNKNYLFIWDKNLQPLKKNNQASIRSQAAKQSSNHERHNNGDYFRKQIRSLFEKLEQKEKKRRFEEKEIEKRRLENEAK